MPIRLRCPSCQSVHAFPETLAARLVRCSKCQLVFRVPTLAPQPVPSAGSGRWLIALFVVLLGLGMLGFVAVLLGVVLTLRPAASESRTQGAERPPQLPAENPQENPPPHAEKAPAQEEGLALDPFPAPFVLPDRPNTLSLPRPSFPNHAKVLFPTPASPFVAFSGDASEANAIFTVWDLRNGQQFGTLKLDGNLYSGFSLSPDGRFLAAPVREHSHTELEVWSVVEGRSHTLLNLQEPGYTLLSHAVFTGPGQLLTTQTGPKDSLLRLWDVATAKCLRRFQARLGLISITAYAVSPGGRYLAAAHQKSDRIVICDLTAGKVLGEWPVPIPNSLMYTIARAIAFSQDGRSVYLLYLCGLDFYLATFAVRTGQVSMRPLKGWGDLSNPILTADFDTGPLLQSLADGRLLFAGYMLVDPQSGRVVRKLPPPALQGDIRRVLGAKWAQVTGAGGNRQLVVEPCPPP